MMSSLRLCKRWTMLRRTLATPQVASTRTVCPLLRLASPHPLAPAHLQTCMLHAGSVNVTLLQNPSHLEAVDPVVVGKVRAKQLDGKP